MLIFWKLQCRCKKYHQNQQPTFLYSSTYKSTIRFAKINLYSLRYLFQNWTIFKTFHCTVLCTPIPFQNALQSLFKSIAISPSYFEARFGWMDVTVRRRPFKEYISLISAKIRWCHVRSCVHPSVCLSVMSRQCFLVTIKATNSRYSFLRVNRLSSERKNKIKF